MLDGPWGFSLAPFSGTSIRGRGGYAPEEVEAEGSGDVPPTIPKLSNAERQPDIKANGSS